MLSASLGRLTEGNPCMSFADLQISFLSLRPKIGKFSTEWNKIYRYTTSQVRWLFAQKHMFECRYVMYLYETSSFMTGSPELLMKNIGSILQG
jgi:hypothetical protein